MEIYSFLEHEISKHPEMQHRIATELREKECDSDFWDELTEHLDCLRICDACHKPMIEGYCIDDGREHYCSDDCLHTSYSDSEFKEMYADGEGNSYWSVWWE